MSRRRQSTVETILIFFVVGVILIYYFQNNQNSITTTSSPTSSPVFRYQYGDGNENVVLEMTKQIESRIPESSGGTDPEIVAWR